MSNKPICLLDLGGVVFQATGSSNDIIDWDIISQLNHIHGHDLNIGRNAFPAFMDDYNQRTGLHLDGQTFLELLWQTLSFNNELVDGLRQHYDIVIVSDNYRENIEYISPLFQFSTWSVAEYYSFDFQLEKSNPLFFERLLSEMKVDGKTLIFIDDSPRKLDSAADFGIKGYLFSGNESVRELII